jgi:preprotein translocase subunit SecD
MLRTAIACFSGDRFYIQIQIKSSSIRKNNQAFANLFEPTQLIGKYITEASAENAIGNSWNIAIKFDTEGEKIFTDLTKSFAGTGQFTEAQANGFAVQLRSKGLPATVESLSIKLMRNSCCGNSGK